MVSAGRSQSRLPHDIDGKVMQSLTSCMAYTEWEERRWRAQVVDGGMQSLVN